MVQRHRNLRCDPSTYLTLLAHNVLCNIYWNYKQFWATRGKDNLNISISRKYWLIISKLRLLLSNSDWCSTPRLDFSWPTASVYHSDRHCFQNRRWNTPWGGFCICITCFMYIVILIYYFFMWLKEAPCSFGKQIQTQSSVSKQFSQRWRCHIQIRF